MQQLRAASPQPRLLPAAIYGGAARRRVSLIRARTLSPRRRSFALEVRSVQAAPSKDVICCLCIVHGQGMLGSSSLKGGGMRSLARGAQDSLRECTFRPRTIWRAHSAASLPRSEWPPGPRSATREGVAALAAPLAASSGAALSR